MMRLSIDARGQAANRRAVAAIQKLQGSATRKAEAQAKRDRRRAKRAGGPGVIVLHKMPAGGFCQSDPNGAYVWGGGESARGRYQVVVAGPLVATVDDYRAAVSRWCGKPLRVAEEAPLGRPDPDQMPERPYLSIILEPAP